MARSLRPLKRFDTSQFQPTEEMLLKPVPIGGLRGMDKKTPLPTMDPQTLRLVRDLVIRYNSYAARDGTNSIGTVSGSELLYACDVHLQDGSAYIVRFKVNGVDIFSAGAWVAATGVFNGSRSWPFSITGWNDRILFSCGVGRMYELIFSPSFQVREIMESPANIIHLATFNGRVMASLFGTQVRWSVKFDHTDWNGLGSGFEDLQSAAGGKPDQQCAIVPVSDELAYCVRSASVWQIGNTGDPDIPFSFSRAYTGVGSRLPMTVAPTERGFICVGPDSQIWIVDPAGYEDIAPPIVSDLEAITAQQQDFMSGAYDVKFKEYRITLPTSSTTSTRVLRYSRMNKAWTEDTYPFPMKSIAYTFIITGMSVDELVGTTDALAGATDDLGTPTINKGFIYTMKGSVSMWVVKDDVTMTPTVTKDLKFDGTRIAAGFRLESGDVKLTDPIKRQEFAEMLMWYESDASVTLVAEFSEDGGVTWNQIGSVVAPITGARSEPISIQQTMDRPHLQFALSTLVAPNTRIVSIAAMMREGARITDAR